MNNIEETLTRRVQDILPTKKLLEDLLSSGKKIRLYQGFDPSRPDLHIGHLVGLLQLKAFQDLGHEVIFLIGDFTGMIGDPTDKSATRPKLTREEVKQNAKTYQDQAGKILSFTGENPVQLKFNSQWLDKLGFADVLELASNITVQQMIERDMYQERIKAEKPIFMHEFMYPLLQGYDSVAMEVDLEVGGNDQLFNMLTGRTLMKALKNKEKFVLTTRLLTDGEGRKIGKTTGNAVNLFGHPNDAYGQIMSFPDDSIINAFTLATNVPLEEIEQIRKEVEANPMAAKKRLAHEIVKLCHGTNAADTAADNFQKTVQDGMAPEDVETFTPTLTGESSLFALVKDAGFGESNGQIKRTIEQGGVSINDQKITDSNQIVNFKSGDIIKFGKREFKKIA